jgi:RNA polymerase sigma-70 factor (ECF subfamily)
MTPSPTSPQKPRLRVVGGSRREPDDAALALAIARGDAGAPGRAWDRFATLVRGILRRSLGPGADVDDQVQRAFLELFREAKHLRDPGSLRAFLIGITVRVARSELRRRRFRGWLMLTNDGTVPEPAAPEVDDDAREAVARLYAVLEKLDDKSRMLFVLRHVEGLELTETAEAMGISLATAKRHLAKVTARVHAMAARDAVLASYLDAGGEEEAHGDDQA